MRELNTELVIDLYEKYADDLRSVRKEQRELLRGPTEAGSRHPRAGRAGGDHSAMKAQLDDLEAEITYLLLRHHRPDTVVEIGCLHGWSTTWLLRALRDNGRGQLHSYDIVDHAIRHVPPDLSAKRWTFHRQDARHGLAIPPEHIGYLFIDAAHSARFARWYLADLVPYLAPGTPVSVHDVFHRHRPLPFSEGAVLLSWLRRGGLAYFTAAPKQDPETHRHLVRIRDRHGLTEPVHSGRDNPMVYFSTLTAEG